MVKTDPVFFLEQNGDYPIIINATIQDLGGHSVKNAGVCWSSSNERPSVESCEGKKETSVSGNAFQAELPCFNAGERYHVTAYLNTAEGETFYSSNKLTVTQSTLFEFEDTKEFKVGSEGGIIEIPFRSNSEYEVVIPENVLWLHIEDTRAMEDHSVRISFDENYDVYERKAVVTLKSKDNSVSAEYSILQAQKDILLIEKNSLTYDYGAYKFEVKVESNVEYDINIGADWIKDVTSRSYGVETKTFSVAENTSGKDREGEITFTSKDKKLEQVLSIKQIDQSLKFEDVNFLNLLLETYDIDDDGMLSIREAENVKVLDFGGKQYTSLKGIENLTNLKSIYVEGTQIAEVDFGSNKKLELIWLSKNPNLTSLKLNQNPVLFRINCPDNKLTSLDVSNCNKLKILNCDDNEIEKLNVSNCPELDEVRAESNKLTGLDMSTCPKLRILFAGNNEKLSNINVTKNTELFDLRLRRCAISSIDVSKNGMLDQLQLADNPLKSLDLSGIVSLCILNVENTSLPSLDISMLKDLTNLHVRYCKFETLDISHNRKIEVLYANSKSLKTVYVWKGFDAANLRTFYIDDTTQVVEK